MAKSTQSVCTRGERGGGSAFEEGGIRTSLARDSVPKGSSAHSLPSLEHSVVPSNLILKLCIYRVWYHLA